MSRPIHHTTARDGSVPAREGVLLGACGALLDPSFPPIAMQATERPTGEQEMDPCDRSRRPLRLSIKTGPHRAGAAEPPVSHTAAARMLNSGDNGPMTRADLIQRIALKQPHLSERDVEFAVKRMLATRWRNVSPVAGASRSAASPATRSITARRELAATPRPERRCRFPRGTPRTSGPARGCANASIAGREGRLKPSVTRAGQRSRTGRQRPLIRDWPDVLCCAATMAAGTIPLSQLLRKLAAYPRQHDLGLALREIGRIERTVFIIDWLLDAELGRRAQIRAQQGRRARRAHARGWCVLSGRVSAPSRRMPQALDNR